MSDSQQQPEDLQENVETANEDRPVVELPGRRLRETREAKHLSREEVANHLRLDVQLIIALEDDQYSRLPSPAYICGYLRSYARLLKLPETEIVEAYSHGEQINSDLIPSSVQIKPQKQVNPGLVKFIIIIVVLILIGVGVYFLVSKYKIFSSTGSDNGKTVSQSTEIPVPAATGTVTESLKTSPQANAEQTHTAAADNHASPVKKSVPPIPPAELKTGIAKVEKLPTPKSTIPASEPVSSALKTAVNTSNANTAGTTASVNKTAPASTTGNSGAVNTSAAAMGELRMHFTDDSWVEVTDSANNRLVYRLIEKGSDIQLEGVPPFTILLGNAPGVQVFYKGKEFDHKNYHRNQVAYFKVGGK